MISPFLVPIATSSFVNSELSDHTPFLSPGLLASKLSLKDSALGSGNSSPAPILSLFNPYR